MPRRPSPPSSSDAPANWTSSRKRHAAYVCGALREVERDWGAEDGTLWLGKYRHLIDDVRCALDWAASETGDRGLGGWISRQSATLWFALSPALTCARRQGDTFAETKGLSWKVDPDNVGRITKLRLVRPRSLVSNEIAFFGGSLRKRRTQIGSSRED